MEPQRRRVLEEFGLVQVSLRGEGPSPFNPSLVLQRWTALLACSIQRAYAASLLGKPLGTCACVNGPAVHVGDLDRLLCA